VVAWVRLAEDPARYLLGRARSSRQPARARGLELEETTPVIHAMPLRPPLGGAAKEVESVRLDPDLRDETARRAARDGVTVSEIIRRALRDYLGTA
jgi:hypothetical protein